MKTETVKNSNGQIVWIALAQIQKSPLNPRVYYDEEKILDMVASFRSQGFRPEMSHLLVRPASNGYELVCGHRRWMAAGRIPLEQVPAVVSPLHDAEVIVMQLIENLQREGLNPIEEGEGFRSALAMRSDGGKLIYTVESLAKLLGKTAQTIGDRLRLVRLRGTYAGELVETGELPVTHARLLARIPSAEMRDKVARRVMNPPDGMGPMHRRQLERLIHDECMVQLRGAEFETADATLVPPVVDASGERVAGGACTDCPFNTRNMDEGPSAKMKFHMCMNVDCYHAKRAAAHERWMSTVVDPAANRVALPLEQSEKLFDVTGSRLAYNSGYVDLGEPPPEHDLKRGIQNPPVWKKLVRGRGIQVVVVKDGEGKVRELADHKVALEAARANDAERLPEDRIFKNVEPATKKATDDLTVPSVEPSPVEAAAKREVAKQQEAAQVARERELRVMKAEFEAVVTAAGRRAEAGDVRGPKGFWFSIVRLLIDVTEEHGDAPSVAAGLGLTASGPAVVALRQQCQKLKEDDAAQFALFMRMALHFYAGKEPLEEGLKSWAKVFGVRLAEVRSEVLASIAAEAKKQKAQSQIRERLAWGTQKQEADEFEWNEQGACINPDVATLRLSASVTKAKVRVGKCSKGWVWGIDVQIQSKAGKSAMPRMTAKHYSSRALALRAALKEIESFLHGMAGCAKPLAEVREYLESMGQVPEPARQKATAPKPKRAKAKKGAK